MSHAIVERRPRQLAAPPVNFAFQDGRNGRAVRYRPGEQSASLGTVDIKGFDLNLLKVLDALIAERHVTRAGLRVGLGQSSMSGALARLRELFGDELFVRTPAGMAPTPRALDLAGPVADALRLVKGALGAEAFIAAQAEQAFTIAMSDYAAFVLLPPLLARLGAEAPGVDLHVRGMFGRGEAIDLLDRGEASLAIGVPVEASARILSRRILLEGFACIARAGHPAFASGGDIAAFAAAPHLLVSPEGDREGLVDRRLAELGLRRRVRLSLPQFLVAPFVVAGSDLVATLAGRLACKFAATGFGIDLHEAPIELPEWPLAMMWHRRADAHAADAWLRDVVTEVAASI